MSEAAPPPKGFPRGGAWGSAPTGDVGADCTTTGLDAPAGPGQILRGHPNTMTFQKVGCATIRPGV